MLGAVQASGVAVATPRGMPGRWAAHAGGRNRREAAAEPRQPWLWANRLRHHGPGGWRQLSESSSPLTQAPELACTWTAMLATIKRVRGARARARATAPLPKAPALRRRESRARSAKAGRRGSTGGPRGGPRGPRWTNQSLASGAAPITLIPPLHNPDDARAPPLRSNAPHATPWDARPVQRPGASTAPAPARPRQRRPHRRRIARRT